MYPTHINASIVLQFMQQYPLYLTPRFVLSYDGGQEQIFCSSMHVTGEVLLNLAPYDSDHRGAVVLQPAVNTFTKRKDQLQDMVISPFNPVHYAANVDHLRMIMESCVEAYNQALHEHSGWSVFWMWSLPGPEYEIELHY